MLGLLVCAHAQAANDWVSTATYKPGSTLQNNRLCYTDGTDIACDGAAGLLTASGTLAITNVSATGNISANKFIGDGSGLTGVVASTGDRLVSGTTSMVAVSNTGFISVTQSATNTAWFDPTRGLVTLGVSATGPISATSIYAGDFGTSQSIIFRDANGVLSGYSNMLVSNSGIAIGGNLSNLSTHKLYVGGNAVIGGGGAINSNYFYLSGGWTSGMGGSSSSGYNYVTLIASGTEAVRIVSTGYVGIGTSTPSRLLDVSGSSLFQNTITVGTAGNGYSSTKMMAGNDPNNYLLLHDGGGDMALYTYGSRRLSVDYKGNVAIGSTTTPSQTLHVQGSALITSWTGINFSGR